MKVELPEKRYYSIGEVAEAFDVNTSLIRYWETEFSILNPKKNSKGNRKFTTQDIENLKHVYFLVKEKAKEDLYFRLDNHWNYHGGYALTNYLRSRLLSDFPNKEIPELPTVE